jgi:hypothetical protein
MRDESPPQVTDSATKGEHAQAVDQAQQLANGAQQASQTPGAESNPMVDVSRQVDQAIAESFGLSNDLTGLSLTRQQMNELAQKLPDINGLLNFGFTANEAIEFGSTLGKYLGNYALAMDPSVPDAVADQHFAAMDALARQMIASGIFGSAFASFMEAFPTAGAVIGSYMASYNGTRWVLENTRGGQIIDRTVGRGFDALLNSRDALVDSLQGLTGGESRSARDAKLGQKYIEIYKSSLDKGRIRLRKGVPFQRIVDAVYQGTDIPTINRTLLEPAGPSIPNRTPTAEPKPPPLSDGEFASLGGDELLDDCPKGYLFASCVRACGDLSECTTMGVWAFSALQPQALPTRLHEDPL